MCLSGRRDQPLQEKVPETGPPLAKSVPEKVPFMSDPMEPDCLPVARAHGTPPARPPTVLTVFPFTNRSR